MDDLAAEAEALARDEAEQQRLRTRRRHLSVDLDAASERVLEATGRAQAEQSDVERLESFSPTRVLAAIRGSRDDDLRREEAEAQQAAYALARARADRDALDAELQHLRAREQTIGDVPARREDLRRRVAERAARSGAPGGEELARISGRIGQLADEGREVDEALTSARAAREALQDASEVLASAGSWSTYDTFFGGGLIADAVKHDRLDRAQELMRRADHATERFRRELEDVGGGAVGGLGIGSGERIFDVFFDNIISDWAVRSRIEESADRVQATLRGVVTVADELAARAERITTERHALQAERAALVDDALG